MSNQEQKPEWLKDGADVSSMPELELRDYLFSLDLNLDIQSQLVAIHALLKQNRKADENLQDEIREVEEHAKKVSGLLEERAVEEWLDRLHHSVYQDAAHSMAAVGMLAPLVESLFFQCFRGVGLRYFPQAEPCTPHHRWEAAHAVQWDCHFVIHNGQSRADLVRGIMQLAEATGLVSRLPADLQQTLSALFAYRNKMFHLGFEWPLEERQRFADRIVQEHWPEEWFSNATSAGQPWIFYMTDVFVGHVVDTINGVLDAFAIFVRDDLFPKAT